MWCKFRERGAGTRRSSWARSKRRWLFRAGRDRSVVCALASCRNECVWIRWGIFSPIPDWREIKWRVKRLAKEYKIGLFFMAYLYWYWIVDELAQIGDCVGQISWYVVWTWTHNGTQTQETTMSLDQIRHVDDELACLFVFVASLDRAQLLEVTLKIPYENENSPKSIQ